MMAIELIEYPFSFKRSNESNGYLYFKATLKKQDSSTRSAKRRLRGMRFD